ncbi:MAG: TonB-dependent receptor [Pseudomonadales bacterium]|nr:TonB-dependent receptor [Pseudomonadales bacterium]
MRVPYTFKLKSVSTLATSIASALLLSGGASAQDITPEIQSIEVTGSRISRDGYDMPTPVSVLNDDDIDAEAPGSVAEFAMTLPSIQGSSTASTNSGALSNGQSGISALNLRGLGTGRTLVLFDGQRSVASSSAGQVDTNTFPQSLVSRIEVVSGGASSAYGSDAIAGVVNFILDKDYTGVKTAIEYGEVSGYGAASQRIELTAGSDFANGQGHFLFSTEYYDQEGIRDRDVDWQLDGFMGIVNPDKSEGAPFYHVGENIGISAYTPGGLIVDGPLRGTFFGDGGEVGQLEFGTVSNQWMIGGDWRLAQSSILGTNSLQADSTRKSVFGRASWELSPTIEVFAQGSYASYEGDSDYIRPTDRNRTIQIDNAFLPQSIRDQMIAEGITSFKLSSARADIPLAGANNFRETTRFVIGGEGMFEMAGLGIDWDTYYQKGKTDTDEHQNPTWSFAALDEASDAIFDSSGNIVCRSGNPACVPLNSFGVGVASAEALEFVLGRPRREQTFDQDVFALNFNTSDLEGWAGPIGLAAGVEWRKDKIDGFVDPKFSSGWKYGNYKVTTGKQTVKEIYVESVVPLMTGLEFNGAARYTDYSNSGGVTTWKAGLTYQPIYDLTFRITQSRDIRAPNLSELFDSGTARSNSVAINGASTPFIQNLQGNPTVGPEKADAFGFGVVLQPEFLPGFATSIDYYDIKVKGVIDFLTAQDVADACLLFNEDRFCPRLRFDDSGTLQFIDLKFENLNSLLSEGIDIEASYSFDFADIFGSVPGEMSLRFMTTHYMKNATDDGVTIEDHAGENSGTTPNWVYRATVRYTLDDWTVNLTGRGHSDGVIDNDFIECVSSCPVSTAANRTINDNSVNGKWFFDTYLSKTLMFGDGEGELFLSVKNVFDSDPVVMAFPELQGTENRAGFLPANRNLNDVIGRNFRLGMRYEF